MHLLINSIPTTHLFVESSFQSTWGPSLLILNATLNSVHSEIVHSYSFFPLTSEKKDHRSTIKNAEKNNEGHSLWEKSNIYCMLRQTSFFRSAPQGAHQMTLRSHIFPFSSWGA